MVLFFVGSVAQGQEPPMPDPGPGGATAPAECQWILDQLDQLDHIDIPAQEEVVRLAQEAMDQAEDHRNNRLQMLINAEQEGANELYVEFCRDALRKAETELAIAEALYQLAMQWLQILQMMSWMLHTLFECSCMG